MDPGNEDNYMFKWRKLGDCLLISTLPGRASRMIVDIARLAG